MAKGISLHIGLNKLKASAYKGEEGWLLCCEADAKAMANIALTHNFSKLQLLLTEQATCQAFISQMEAYSKCLEAGDLFFLSFSGHGSSLRDQDGDEPDGRDESWCLYDGRIRDDKIYELLQKFKSGVRIIVISDSCHSGTVIRWDEETKKAKTKKAKEKPTMRASVHLIASSQDDEESKAGEPYSVFTAELLDVWDKGKFKGGYRALRNAIIRSMPLEQTPNYFYLGPPKACSIAGGADEEQIFSI